jgi:hypothetical protein
MSRSKGQHLNSPVQEQPRMLEKDFRVLRLRSVAGIRIHHELGVWQVLHRGDRKQLGRDGASAWWQPDCDAGCLHHGPP